MERSPWRRDRRFSWNKGWTGKVIAVQRHSEREDRSTDEFSQALWELLLDLAEKKGLGKGKREEQAKAEAKMLEEKRNIAREFKKLGVPIADIAKGTGLSIEEIEKL